ncbi:Cytochrome P450 6a14 [Carabus blaptoides fortunei]
MLDIYSQFRDTGCKYGGFYMFNEPILMLLDPELIKQILTKDFEYFHDRSGSANEKDDPLSGHLFVTTGKKWKSLRKKTTPTFTSGKMKMMFQTLLTCAEELEETLQEPVRTGVPVNIKDILGRYTTDVIGSCVFGLNCNSLKDPNTEFYHYAKLFVNGTLSSSIKFILSAMFGTILNILKIRRIDRDVSNFFFNVLKSTIQYREANKIHRNDFVELFIKMKNNESIDDDDRNVDSKDDLSDAITFNELAAQAFIFFIAGYESSSTTLAFCLYELSLQPQIQDKLRMEILTKLNKNNGEISYSVILEMEYLDKVFKGTLTLK